MEQLTEQIYVYPGDFQHVQPWIGVVLTSDGTVLIDSGNGPIQAAQIQTGLDMLGAPPVTYILLTHHHWDHVFGNCVFPQATIVAHELTQYHLQVMAREPWSAAYVQDKAGEDRVQQAIARMLLQAIPDWETFQVVPAHLTFTDSYRLELGGLVFLMEHVGGSHEPDQCVVHVRPGNVLFLGDAAYGRGRQHEWDVAALTGELEGFLEWGADYYVTGHNPPATPEQFKKRIALLRSKR